MEKIKCYIGLLGHVQVFFWIIGYESIRELGMNQSYNKKNYLNACVWQRAFKNNQIIVTFIIAEIRVPVKKKPNCFLVLWNVIFNVWFIRFAYPRRQADLVSVFDRIKPELIIHSDHSRDASKTSECIHVIILIRLM